MISESTFIDRIKKEFPDAIENQTKSYISFQAVSYTHLDVYKRQALLLRYSG